MRSYGSALLFYFIEINGFTQFTLSWILFLNYCGKLIIFIKLFEKKIIYVLINF